MTLLLLFTAALIGSTASNAQQPSAAIDVTHYRFSVALSEQSDTIMGEATIKLKVIKPTKSVSFDLTSLQADGKGMSVLSVSGNSPFTHQKNILTIQSGQMQVGDVKEYTIAYKGIPADGLIIGKNKYGKKVFFADHWPDRARNWLPCVDHPADKAEVVFIVTAPAHYQVVANGIQKEETSLGENMKRTRYEESIPLPTKVMVIGVADFAVQYAGDAGPVPVFSWVYPEERENGFYDFAQALDILPFFINKIGPYGYRKLANVQSKTRFGGLENANTIFYHENSITGTRTTTSLLAHEIAHQWFGNMVTEKEWAHVWLSEGFATYLTTCFMEETYGKDTALQMRREDREQVIAFARKDKRPVVDNAVTDYMQLLNANSYQKGGWILHMLRKEVGDSTFWHILQLFYENYKGKNADTEDLLKVVNQVSKRDYSAFFRQWLYQSGIPMVELSWTYDGENRQVSLTVKQLQDGLFQFPLAVDFLSNDRQPTKRITLSISQKEETFKIDMPFDPTKLIVDPEVDLLFSATIINR